jgi:hypothetical protein
MVANQQPSERIKTKQRRKWNEWTYHLGSSWRVQRSKKKEKIVVNQQLSERIKMKQRKK